MANTDKNIVITPNIGSSTADPKIVFSGADASTAAQNITLQVYPTNNGTLSFEGNAGQLFSITNSMSGTIYSVNDVSGIPSIEVLDTGTIKLGQYSGSILLGTGTDNGTDKLQVNGSILGTTLKATTITRNSRNVPTYVSSATAPSSPLQGDLWYNSSSDIIYQYVFDGTNLQWVDVSSALTNSSTSATANTLALRDASADLYATTFRGKATSAQYADLAENYVSDREYKPGTVVVFGGDKEITTSDIAHDTRVAGIISSNPAYLMNSDCNGLPVAFTGRVPCYVQGPIAKGDRLVNVVAGIAGKMNIDLYEPGCIIGKSLEAIDSSTIQLIEVAVGRY